MLIDGRRLAGRRSVEADVCVVGAGPAGLSLASELDARAIAVCLLESGGVEGSHQSLDGDTASPIHDAHHLRDARCSGLGGTANLWEIDVGAGGAFVRYALPDALDLEPRSPLRPASWPLSLASLAPFVSRASKLGGISEDALSAPVPHDPPAGEGLSPKRFALGPATALTRDAWTRLERSATTTVALRSTALGLELARSGDRVESVLAACASGTFRVTARLVVLAGGAPENARLLLLSKGPWNEHDVVGRYLTDHPFVEVGLVTPLDPLVFERSAFYDVRRIGDSYTMGYLSPDRRALEEHGLLNAAVFLFPRPRAYGSGGVVAARELSLSRGLDLATLRRAAAMAVGVRDVVSWLHQRRVSPASATDAKTGGWSSQPGLAKTFAHFRVEAQLEQAPHPENRVTLSRSRDSLGRPRLQLRWSWNRVEHDSYQRLQAFLGRMLAASTNGSFRPGAGLAGAFSPHHLMGTTRMHEDPEQGVVDGDCRAHGTENLFVTGSSVFPNSLGAANPTLTIMALAMRLSDHVATLL